MCTDDLVELAPTTKKENNSKTYVGNLKNETYVSPLHKINVKHVYCNNKSRPGLLVLEIVYVLKPSGGTDTLNASKYLGV